MISSTVDTRQPLRSKLIGSAILPFRRLKRQVGHQYEQPGKTSVRIAVGLNDAGELSIKEHIEV